MSIPSSLQSKVLEIRDSATFIPVLCVDINPPAGIVAWYAIRLGYPCDGRPNVILSRLSGDGKSTNDPYAWGDRTFAVAHHYIIENWHELSDGDVVDVEFILGEKSFKKVSERLTIPMPETVRP